MSVVEYCKEHRTIATRRGAGGPLKCCYTGALETSLMESTSNSIQIGLLLEDCQEQLAEYENDETPTRRELGLMRRRMVALEEMAKVARMCDLGRLAEWLRHNAPADWEWSKDIALLKEALDDIPIK